MSRAFLIKEIAVQAGLSAATVDRVVNGRSGVRVLTQQRVAEAIRELEAQSRQRALTGRKFIIDLVMEAPARFTKEVRGPPEAERPPLEPAVDPPGDGAFKIALRAGASAADCPSTPCGKIISILPQLR
jgi:LacI family transcriptional regulator